MRILVAFVLLSMTLVGCEAVTGVMDDWFTQEAPNDVSDAEHLDDSLGWLLPSPVRELVSAIVGGVAVYWTTSRRNKAKSAK